ncbi:MAG: 23S rRNA pseudouridine(1911/1915/1917) synthase RluD [Gammaproteobacteria bacterium]|nr:MAG: 23S rRNA pseudouridine(1911/1915/1917) synthase RluD [Gammaproteobacteria bacterium]RLA54802.1 MAG: 23S rRNA pseudouridine(1911/1915/1917) synthase RluD [Gammaproteobacteria bacterium]
MQQDQLYTRLKQQVPDRLRGCRLDQAAASVFPDYSRARLQKWIRDGRLNVDDRPGNVREKLLGGEWLTLEVSLTPEGEWQAQQMDLDIVYEDSAILVVNKPAGLVVHPGAGNPDRTLLNGLLYHCQQLESVPRAGIVHRLDKDTTGLLVVAKTLVSHHSLVDQLKARSVSREYHALVQGATNQSGTVDEPIGRHPVARTRMAVTRGGGKPAVTHYRRIARYRGYTYLQVMLETGRTHQIRVHMAHIGHPLLGDPLYTGGYKGGHKGRYGGRQRVPGGVGAEVSSMVQSFGRQALHAAYLALRHPESGEAMSWRAPNPEDMKQLISLLDADSAGV